LPTGLGNSLHNCFQPTPYSNPMEETTPTPRSSLGFQPRLDCDPFKTFWSTGTAWGTATLTRKQGRWTLVELQVIHGGLANHPA